MNEEHKAAIRAIRALQSWVEAVPDEVPEWVRWAMMESASEIVDRMIPADMRKVYYEVLYDDDAGQDDTSDEFWNEVESRVKED